MKSTMNRHEMTPVLALLTLTVTVTARYCPLLPLRRPNPPAAPSTAPEHPNNKSTNTSIHHFITQQEVPLPLPPHAINFQRWKLDVEVRP